MPARATMRARPYVCTQNSGNCKAFFFTDNVIFTRKRTAKSFATFMLAISSSPPSSRPARCRAFMDRNPLLKKGYEYASVAYIGLFGRGKIPLTLLGFGLLTGLYFGIRYRKDTHGGYSFFYKKARIASSSAFLSSFPFSLLPRRGSLMRAHRPTILSSITTIATT